MSIGKEILNSCLAALVTFVFLVGGIFLWGKGCNHSDTPDSPAGEYYWEGSSVGQLETIVKIHEDGTWDKTVYEAGEALPKSAFRDMDGTWKIEIVEKGSVKNPEVYQVIVFNNKKYQAFIYDNGCVFDLNDAVMINSDFGPAGGAPFGLMHTTESASFATCRE